MSKADVPRHILVPVDIFELVEVNLTLNIITNNVKTVYIYYLTFSVIGTKKNQIYMKDSWDISLNQ